MPERSDIVERADALIRRRRNFVDRPAAPEHAAAAEALLSFDEDDIPVLTEIAPEDAEPSAEPLNAAVEPRGVGGGEFEELSREIATAVEWRVARDLPALLEVALRKAGDDLRAGIAASIDDALRDALAGRLEQHAPARDAADPAAGD